MPSTQAHSWLWSVLRVRVGRLVCIYYGLKMLLFHPSKFVAVNKRWVKSSKNKMTLFPPAARLPLENPPVLSGGVNPHTCVGLRRLEQGKRVKLSLLTDKG